MLINRLAARHQVCCVFGFMLLSLVIGCNEKPKSKKKPTDATPVAKQDQKAPKTTGNKPADDKAAKEKAAKEKAAKEKEKEAKLRAEELNAGWSNPNISRSSQKSFQPVNNGGNSGGYTSTGDGGGFDRVEGEIRSAAGDRKTLVVYICDQAASNLVNSVADRASRLLKGTGPASKIQENLSAAVVSYGDEVKILTPEPITDGAALARILHEVRGNSTPGKLTYQAVNKAAETFGSWRGKDYEVLFVILAEEAQTDEEFLKQAVAKLRRDYIPVYAYGSPVAFYSSQQKASPGKPAGASWGLEHITVYTPARLNDADYADSGYGNFGLERICRMTDGKFFRTAGHSSEGWATDNGQIKPELIRKYAPEYISEAEYLAKAEQNKARRALLEASKLVIDAQFEPPAMSFAGGSGDNQARFANSITMAQRKAAAPQQEFEKILTVLQAGESDRNKLGSPRWEAAFDLALGRAYAAMARTLGYNKMLAQIKQGKAFSDPSKNMWVLVSSQNFSGDSQLNTMAKKSREYLQRVIDNHPGTPWADIASKEIMSECGWDWQEQ